MRTLLLALGTVSRAQFQCSTTDNICDGTKDCFDGTDEIQCQNCGPNQFSCNGVNSNAQCIDSQFICNGQRDCANGLDEQNCLLWGGWGPWDQSTCSSQKCQNANTCDADCVIIRQRGCFDRDANPMSMTPSPSCGNREVLCGDLCGVSVELQGTCPGCDENMTPFPTATSQRPSTGSSPTGEKCWTDSYFDCWWIWLIIVLIIIIILIIILCILKFCCTSCWAAVCGCACLKKNNKTSGNLDTLRRNTLVPDHARPTAAKGTRFENYD